MSAAKKPTAIEKRAQNSEALTPFALTTLKEKLPLVFQRDLDLPPSPKPHYRSVYRYLGFDDLNERTIEIFSPFEIAVRLFDYSHLERLLAAHIYVASAKGQVPFHPVSMYLLSNLPARAERFPARGTAHLATSSGGAGPTALYRVQGRFPLRVRAALL
jgi:hypothetical protein